MEKVYQLRRKSGGSGGLNWHYANRLVDEAGQILFAGETPNGYFKKPVMFADANGQDALSFGADRRIAPSAFISQDAFGNELFHIELPLAVRLRRNAPFRLTAVRSDQEMEIVPVQNVAGNELNRVVCVFVDEFVVRRNGGTVAFSGDLSPENSPDDFARQAVTGAARKIFSDLRKIPGNLRAMGSGERPETVAGQLTVSDPNLGDAFALTLLLFRTYIFSDFQTPKEAWWQGE